MVSISRSLILENFFLGSKNEGYQGRTAIYWANLTFFPEGLSKTVEPEILWLLEAKIRKNEPFWWKVQFSTYLKCTEIDWNLKNWSSVNFCIHNLIILYFCKIVPKGSKYGQKQLGMSMLLFESTFTFGNYFRDGGHIHGFGFGELSWVWYT